MGSGMRTFGGQTVTFVTVEEDLDTRDRYNKPAPVRTETDVPGCRFRPLPATATLTDGTVLAAKPNDELVVDGVTYQIVGGPRTFVDIGGQPFKTTVICERLDASGFLKCSFRHTSRSSRYLTRMLCSNRRSGSF